ncbi:hypothetical protein JTB14_015443 [Gonioctena quinquepunctata]|nr:hypothetical protein JTB14_015443 [Gonioctena quinquepunctata]
MFISLLLLSVSTFFNVIDASKCNPYYLRDAMVEINTKENFQYYPWVNYKPIEGTVKYMKLRDQRVPELCKYFLPANVKEVIFYNIQLDYIEPGFFYSDTLEQVTIQLNNLRHIIRGVFSDTNIKSLVLSENNIQTIDAGSFENMAKLEAIALDYNNIMKFDPNWFNGARVLYEISFNHNNLTELPEETTRNMVESVDTIFFSKILGCINFDNNEIRHIHPDAFKNLRKFGTISLNNNRLLELSEDVFKRFDFLFSLYMNTNDFICLKNETIRSFHGIKRLFLGENRINKDCVKRIRENFDNKNDLAYF